MEKNNFFESRFSGSIGGKKLETIRKAMPHHDFMQALVKNELTKAFAHSSQQTIQLAEIGTGIGFTAMEALKANERIVLKTCDSEPKMIEEAKLNLEAKIKEGRVLLECKDALSFLQECEDNFFDGLVSGFTLHNFNNEYREKVLAEIFRTLKPEALFINADKFMPDNPEDFEREYAWQINLFKKADVDEETRAGWLEHYAADNRPDIIMHQNDALASLEKIGFHEITISNRNHLEALLTARK